MARSEVLRAMDADRLPFDDARADTVRAFDVLRPDAAKPHAPVLELVRHRLIAAMVESDSLRVAQEDDIVQLPHDRIETIDAFLCEREDRVEDLAAGRDLTLGEDVRCRGNVWIQVMLGDTSVP